MLMKEHGSNLFSGHRQLLRCTSIIQWFTWRTNRGLSASMHNRSNKNTSWRFTFNWRLTTKFARSSTIRVFYRCSRSMRHVASSQNRRCTGRYHRRLSNTRRRKRFFSCLSLHSHIIRQLRLIRVSCFPFWSLESSLTWKLLRYFAEYCDEYPRPLFVDLGW